MPVKDKHPIVDEVKDAQFYGGHECWRKICVETSQQQSLQRLIKQGRTHGISRSPSSFLPAEKNGYGPTDRWTHGPTDPCTDGRMDTPSYRDVCTHLITRCTFFKRYQFYLHNPDFYDFKLLPYLFPMSNILHMKYVNNK